PSQFKLFSVYPNPFNPSTTIRFNIQVETQHVGNPAVSGASSLQIFDITGRVAETLVNEKLLVGEHEIIWNASRFSSGIYFVRLESNGFRETKKIVLVK
ncbi:MAG: T9SS type A sorting domain-containing protein, partial [Candidatus Marinimicrobia bacterium]|nr:T9SS type A sorting domain-containing protein [Candidatus Neomarinimicrobiota bacterium]